MAPRLNKRQLREQEELIALDAAVQDQELSNESDQDALGPSKAPAVGFAALVNQDADDDSDGEVDSRRNKPKKKKKKKKVTAAETTVASTSPSKDTPDDHTVNSPADDDTVAGPSRKERKALKKQKAKEKKDEMDDVDKALAELSLKYPDLKKIVDSPAVSSSARNASDALSSLLSVSLQHLDSDAEMRKFFGSKVISAAKSSTSGPSTPARRPLASQRSSLTRPQSNWWPAQMREGLSTRQLDDKEVAELQARHAWQPFAEKVWTVEYSKKYRGVTLAFMQTVMSGDPEGFWQLLRILPYHADTLLQLSEVYFHREEHSTAADFIDRALFTYERGFTGSFNFTNGNNRLDFDRVENRPFFLAVHRQVTDLQRRGCVRTAFEFARLLYALDPWTDPHGALLHLEFLAIKAGMEQWLLDLWDFFVTKGPFFNRMQPNFLPGWAYARALAMFVLEQKKGDKTHEKSTEALKDAILAFPSVVPLLADQADISQSSEIRGHSAFRIYVDSSSVSTEADSVLQLLCHLYAQRSSSLWKIPARSSWFSRTVQSCLTSLPPSFSTTYIAYTDFKRYFEAAGHTHSIYRHVIVNESTCRRVFPFVPRTITEARSVACDPLPPSTRINEYNSEFFKGVENALRQRPTSRKASERMLERLIPDPVFRRQLQGFFEAHPQFAQQFPGGIVQFAEMAGNMPEEVLEDLMIAQAGAAHAGGQGMPGDFGEAGIMDDLEHEADENRRDRDINVDGAPAQFGGNNAVAEDDEEDEERDDEDDDEEVDVAPLPVRIMRNVLNRFWGAAQAESSSDEEEVQPPNDDDVD